MQLLVQQVVGYIGDAEPGQGGIPHRLRQIHPVVACHLHRLALLALAKRPLVVAPLPALVGDAVVPGQIPGVQRGTVAQQIVRRGHQHEADVRQPLPHQGFGLVLVGGDPEIQPLIHQVGAVIEQGDFQLQIRVTRLECLEPRDHVQAAEGLAHPQVQHTAHLAAPLRHHGVRLQGHRHQGTAVAGILLAEFGEGEAAGGTLHQLGAELGLKLSQLLADVGLGDPEPPRGGRDALLADQGIEDHHLGKTLQHGITRVSGGPPLFQSRPPGGRVSAPAPR